MEASLNSSHQNHTELHKNSPNYTWNLKSKETTFTEIPLVDIGGLIDGTDKTRIATEIGNVFENVGFLYIKNHGIPSTLINAALDVSKELFDLPFEEKNRLNIVHSEEALRGYIPMYRENVDAKNTKDFKETFDFGWDTDEVSPFFGPNLMPQSRPRVQQILNEYFDAMLQLSNKLIQATALSLGLPEDYFDRLSQKPIATGRWIHYPPQTKEISIQEIGIGAHTDYGFLTILNQDQQGGLQVMNRLGEWVEAPPIEDTLVVNIGDFTQAFTNDRYRSTVHRVINVSGSERYSMPFFRNLDWDAEISVVPTCQKVDNPPRYSPFLCGEHVYQRYLDSYTHLKPINARKRCRRMNCTDIDYWLEQLKPDAEFWLTDHVEPLSP